MAPRIPLDEATSRPGNVLLLIADDLGADQLAAYGIGSDFPPTPNLDLMASEGVLFRNAWSQPVCSPTRATLQTGRYAFRTTIGAVINASSNGSGLPLAEVTLPEMLDLGTGARYAHAMIGKWHLGTSQVGGLLAPNLAGYGHFAGSLEGQLAYYTNWFRVVDGVGLSTTRYATSACVDDALAWIGARQGEPWLCVVGFQAPHAPFHAPPANLHTQQLPPGFPPAVCGANSVDPRPFYKAMLQALDSEIGRLLASLPAEERARTTVLFVGDNGSESCALATPGRAKGTLYEGGIHVPLLASGYRVGRGECAALVNTTDVFATVAELAGVDLGATIPGVVLDSVSFAPCLADPRLELREWIFAETFNQNGPGQPPALPPCPSAPVCQPDVGYDGPGTVVLASCGLPLYGSFGNVVPWSVSGGPPLANAWLRIGTQQPAYDTTYRAWVVSSAPSFVLPFQLGASGSYATTTWTGNTSSDLYYQVVVQDPVQVSGFAVSNALRMDLLAAHMRAVRNARYKLIRLDPCREELYDLAADPFELDDLLASPLDAAALQAYLELSARLEVLH